MTPARAAAAAGAVVTAACVGLSWVVVASGDDPPTVSAIGWAFALVGLPFAVAAAAIAYHTVRAAHGPDLPARALAVATAGRTDDSWGAAMRAELASIDDAAERRRFALGCMIAALRTGWGRTPLLAGLGFFVGFAVITLIASRGMLAGDRTGLLVGVLGVPQVLLAAVALLAARAGRSFRAGLEAGVLGLLAALAGTLVVAVPEAVTWYHQAGVWIIDGDYPKGGIPGPGAAAVDALTGLTFFILLFATPWPVIGAALGAGRRPTQKATQHRRS